MLTFLLAAKPLPITVTTRLGGVMPGLTSRVGALDRPCTVTSCELSGALSVNWRTADRSPGAVGENRTVILQVPPAGRLTPAQALLGMEKSPGAPGPTGAT